MADILDRIYPEMGAGGFHHRNGRVAFFTRVWALLPDDPEILDFGAGRGKFAETEPDTMRKITDVRHGSKRFAAFDVDPAVLRNVETTDRHHAEVGQPLPFPDNSFDLIYSWMVFEHVADPDFYAKELNRILRPGGWLCAGTPNKWGVVGMGARLIPNALHVRFLKFFSPSRQEQDTFPTTYRLNRKSDVARYFPPAQFDDFSFYMFNGPAYHARKMWLVRFWLLVNLLLPPTMKQNFQIFLRKK